MLHIKHLKEMWNVRKTQLDNFESMELSKQLECLDEIDEIAVTELWSVDTPALKGFSVSIATVSEVDCELLGNNLLDIVSCEGFDRHHAIVSYEVYDFRKNGGGMTYTTDFWFDRKSFDAEQIARLLLKATSYASTVIDVEKNKSNIFNTEDTFSF